MIGDRRLRGRVSQRLGRELRNVATDIRLARTSDDNLRAALKLSGNATAYRKQKNLEHVAAIQARRKRLAAPPPPPPPPTLAEIRKAKPYDGVYYRSPNGHRGHTNQSGRASPSVSLGDCPPGGYALHLNLDDVQEFPYEVETELPDDISRHVCLSEEYWMIYRLNTNHGYGNI